MSIEPRVYHRTANVDDLSIFYREAGEGHKHAVVLLHGLPIASDMFRMLIPLLADRYHVIAPDFPGFGLSSCPSRSAFPFTFDSLTRTLCAFLDVLDVDEYTLYAMGLTAPVSFRLALEQGDCVEALIIQNGNAYEEGLGAFWLPIKRFWEESSHGNRDALRSLLPGSADVSLDLLYDYRTNLELYPRFQQWFRENQPPALVLWGQNDAIHPVEAAYAFQRDMPHLELEIVDSGHFALEQKGGEMAARIREFLGRSFT
jgi:pimeloyl-ACP methyl ester carboxylesterase